MKSEIELKGDIIMSKFYGQVVGNGETNGTRRGSRNIKVSAQSYDGSLITFMYYDENGNLCVDLDYAEDSNLYGRTMFRGTMQELLEKLSA